MVKPLPILIDQTSFDVAAADCIACYPNEACGILIGLDSESRHIRMIRPAGNIWADTTEKTHRFLIDPLAQLHAERDGAAAGLAVLGFYHSHPDAPPIPSPRDAEAAWPFYSYLILQTTADGVLDSACWLFDETRKSFDRQPLSIV